MAFCLPQKMAEKFIEALKSGDIDPGKLSGMTSAERHSFFSKLVGEGDARDVNALFESKLLLKNQRAGLARWAKQIAGITEPARRDLLSSIERMDKILQPGGEDTYLADLASKKLGASVTLDESNKITELAQKASLARDAMKDTGAWSTERTTYGRSFMDLQDYVESLKPSPSGWGYWAAQVANLPRTSLTSILHFSAPFVQGWGMMGSPHYVEAWGQMFKYFGSEEAFKNLQASIYGHPDFKLAQSGKLSLTDLGDKLTNREEALQSSLLQKVPGLRVPVLASGRSFVGFLNYIRFHRFIDLLNAARVNGEDIKVGSDAVKNIAATVNDFTGRGAFPEQLGIGASWMNAAFFSPRKISGEIRMFNPVRYVDPRVSQTARLGALRQMTGALIATGAILELAHLAGAKVSTNPIDTNFLKIKVGNSTFDVTGGNAIYGRTLARLITNQEVTGTGAHVQLGEKYGSQTRADVAIAFVRGKLAPNAAAMADFLYGKDQTGQPFNLYGEGKAGYTQSELFNKLMPIAIQDMIVLQETHPDAYMWAPALSAVFGVGMETSVPKK